jgi:Mrp family chromosome partitioning ATPase
MLAFAEQKTARVIGITGNRPGVGVSLLSRELAHAYASNGMPVILVDATGATVETTRSAEGRNAPFDLLGNASTEQTGPLYLHLASSELPLPSDRLAIKEAFERVAAHDAAVVVDLPPVYSERIQDAQVLSHVGPACQLVFFVCMSGVITKAELGDSISLCKINRVPVGGVIVNDWKQPAAWLATGW